MTENRQEPYCARCGQELYLADTGWNYPPVPVGTKGELCAACVASLPDEEEKYWR